MGYSGEGSIGTWGAKYRAYIGASTSNDTATSCDVYLTGGGQTYNVDGWNGSSMSFSGKSGLSGNCSGGSTGLYWQNTSWYYSSFKYGTITKTHSAQTLTYYCSFNFGGAGTPRHPTPYRLMPIAEVVLLLIRRSGTERP